MVDYRELVRRARALRGRVGESRFKQLYTNQPSALVSDMGLTLPHSTRAKWGYAVLKSFDFYPLGGMEEEVLKRIRSDYNKQPLHTDVLAPEGKKSQTASALRVLEARGAIRLRKVLQRGKHRLFVAEVFDERTRTWKKARMP